MLSYLLALIPRYHLSPLDHTVHNDTRAVIPNSVPICSNAQCPPQGKAEPEHRGSGAMPAMVLAPLRHLLAVTTQCMTHMAKLARGIHAKV